MKRTVVLTIVAISICFAVNISALEKNLSKSDAMLHQVVKSEPGRPEVVSRFNRAIRLHRLKKNELAYWSPDADEYITTEKYAYLFCNVYRIGKMKSKHRWIAVTTNALNKALAESHKFGGGVAYYQLSYDGKYILFKAFPFDTLHAIAQGKKVVDVKE